jgi:hypothetical protein
MDNFDEYLRQGEPDKAAKAKVWKTAIGLQQVDGLKPSEYLLETAKQNIEGNIAIDEVLKRIDGYYQKQSIKKAKVEPKKQTKYQLELRKF